MQYNSWFEEYSILNLYQRWQNFKDYGPGKDRTIFEKANTYMYACPYS